MLAWLLPTLLLGAPPPAQALPRAQWALEIPKLDSMGGLFAFLERAGEHAALLRPEGWRADFHPLLPLDPAQPVALEAAGVDASGPAVLSGNARARMTCLRLKNPARFEERARARLASLGSAWTTKIGNSRIYGARVDGRLVASYLLRGSTACALVFKGDEGDLLREVAALPTLGPGHPGALRLWAPGLDVRLSGNRTEARAEGEAVAMNLPVRAAAVDAPLAGITPKGLLFVRGVPEPRVLASRTLPVLLELCSACPLKDTARFLDALARETTGALAWQAEGMRRGVDASTRRGLVQGLRHAGALAVNDPEQVRSQLATFARAAGAREGRGGWELPLDGGPLALGVQGRLLWFATDPEAKAHFLPTGDTAKGAPGNSMFFARLDGRAAAQALAMLSILDLLRNPDLARYALATAELEPLLQVTDSVEIVLTARPGEGPAFTAVWRLL